MHYTFGNITGFFAIVIWSFVPLFVTLCAGVPLFLFLGLSCVVTFTAFAAKWLTGGEKVVENLTVAPDALAVSIIGNGLFRGLSWSALLLVNPVEASLINHLWPATIVVFGLLLGGARMKPRHFLGLAAGIVGVLVLVSEGTDLFAKFSLGHGLAIASALIWGAYVAMTQRDERYGGNTVAVGFLVSGVAFLSLSALIEWPWALSVQDIGFVSLAALTGSGGSYLWEIGKEQGDGRTLGLCSLFMPLLAAFWLITFGKSALEPGVVVAALLIFGAAVIVSPHTRRRNIIKVEEIE